MLKSEELDGCLQLASGQLIYADARIPPSIDGQGEERGFLTLVQDPKKRSGDCGHEICENAFEDWSAAVPSMRERREV